MYSFLRPTIILLFVSLLAFVTTAPPARAQSTDTGTRRELTPEESTRRQMDAHARRQREFNKLESRKPNKPTAEMPELFLSEDRLTGDQKRQLQPVAEDRLAYASLLKQKHTGIFKLLSPSSSRLISASSAGGDRTYLPLVGGGAFYSFIKQRHDMDRWAEIRLLEKTLVVGFNGYSLALMCQLGDVALDGVTHETAAVAFLKNLTPTTSFQRAEKAHKIYQSGVWAEGVLYKSSLPAVVNTTYLLRSISYGRADHLLAFRVVREDEDGSLHVLWKKLQEYSKPSLAVRPMAKP